MKKEVDEMKPDHTEYEQNRLEIVEMPVKITMVPAILAPLYEHLRKENQLIIQLQGGN